MAINRHHTCATAVSEPFHKRFYIVYVGVSTEIGAKLSTLVPWKSSRARPFPTIETWATITTHKGDGITEGTTAHCVLITSNSTKTRKRAYLHTLCNASCRTMTKCRAQWKNAWEVMLGQLACIWVLVWVRKRVPLALGQLALKQLSCFAFQKFLHGNGSKTAINARSPKYFLVKLETAQRPF